MFALFYWRAILNPSVFVPYRYETSGSQRSSRRSDPSHRPLPYPTLTPGAGFVATSGTTRPCTVRASHELPPYRWLGSDGSTRDHDTIPRLNSMLQATAHVGYPPSQPEDILLLPEFELP